MFSRKPFWVLHYNHNILHTLPGKKYTRTFSVCLEMILLNILILIFLLLLLLIFSAMSCDTYYGFIMDLAVAPVIIIDLSIMMMLKKIHVTSFTFSFSLLFSKNP